MTWRVLAAFFWNLNRLFPKQVHKEWRSGVKKGDDPKVSHDEIAYQTARRFLGHHDHLLIKSKSVSQEKPWHTRNYHKGHKPQKGYFKGDDPTEWPNGAKLFDAQWHTASSTISTANSGLSMTKLCPFLLCTTSLFFSINGLKISTHHLVIYSPSTILYKSLSFCQSSSQNFSIKGLESQFLKLSWYVLFNFQISRYFITRAAEQQRFPNVLNQSFNLKAFKWLLLQACFACSMIMQSNFPPDIRWPLKVQTKCINP